MDEISVIVLECSRCIIIIITSCCLSIRLCYVCRNANAEHRARCKLFPWIFMLDGNNNIVHTATYKPFQWQQTPSKIANNKNTRTHLFGRLFLCLCHAVCAVLAESIYIWTIRNICQAKYITSHSMEQSGAHNNAYRLLTQQMPNWIFCSFVLHCFVRSERNLQFNIVYVVLVGPLSTDRPNERKRQCRTSVVGSVVCACVLALCPVLDQCQRERLSTSWADKDIRRTRINCVFNNTLLLAFCLVGG